MQGGREAAHRPARAGPPPEGLRAAGALAPWRTARCHARVGNTRRDWLHKLSTTLVRENQAVYVEDLVVSGLPRTRLARNVNDAGWSTFAAMLEYKARRHGRTFARVDRWVPSSRTCSVCGAIGAAKPLHVRTILAAGRAGSSETLVELVSAGAPVPQPAVKREHAGSTA